MAIALQTDASLIVPLEGSITEQFIAHAAISAGALVAKNGDTREVAQADAAAAIVAPQGVAIKAATAGMPVDVVTFGPVSNITGATTGGAIYASNTPGVPCESGGTKTKSTVFGHSESATIMFVRPQVVDWT